MADEALKGQSQAVVDRVVAEILGGRRRVVRVAAPPGAGKSRLVRQVMATALQEQATALIAVQTNAQAIDLATAMAESLQAEGRTHRFGFWPSAEAKEEHPTEMARLRDQPGVVFCESTREANRGPGVMLAVARKWAWHRASRKEDQLLHRRFELGVVDEAYQMRTAELMRFGDALEKLLLVGDPGQLEPFTPVETDRWTGSAASPLMPSPRAVEALLGKDALARFALPASFRLDARAAPVVARCFYPALDFRAVAQLGERALSLAPPGESAEDAALDRAASAGWALLELPAAVTVRDDEAVAAALARLARRLFERRAQVTAEWPPPLRAGRPLEPASVAIAVAHRDQRARVRERLDACPLTAQVTVDTANRLQGREYDVVLVWHPLSGRVDASAFHLDTGRLCVMASRHRQACVLVARAGLADLLDDHLPSGLRPRGAPDDREHDGWLAHRQLLELTAAPLP
jgi:hypothetical protein